MAESSVFQTLNALNVNGHTEKKKTGNVELTYLSWAWAWAEVKKQYEDVSFEIKMFDGLPYIYDEKTGYMVFTSVTINGQTHDMWLPVMDGANQAMKAFPYTYSVKEYKYGKWTGNYVDKTVAAATMMDINKTIMRCLVKNLAMFGLGLYIYSGEDLPEGEDASQSNGTPHNIPRPDFNGDPQLYYQDSAEEAQAAQRAAEVAKQPIGETRAKSLTTELIKNGADPIKVCELYKVPSIRDLTEAQQLNIIKNMAKVVEKCPYQKEA